MRLSDASVSSSELLDVSRSTLERKEVDVVELLDVVEGYEMRFLSDGLFFPEDDASSSDDELELGELRRPTNGLNPIVIPDFLSCINPRHTMTARLKKSALRSTLSTPGSRQKKIS